MEKQTFYRVCHRITLQGLWYDQNGAHTGLIHDKLDFCVNSQLEMPRDKEVEGWLSAAKTIEDLLKWFPGIDLIMLNGFDFHIAKYETNNYKYYDKFQHWLIDQEDSELIEFINVHDLI